MKGIVNEKGELLVKAAEVASAGNGLLAQEVLYGDWLGVLSVVDVPDGVEPGTHQFQDGRWRFNVAHPTFLEYVTGIKRGLGALEMAVDALTGGEEA